MNELDRQELALYTLIWQRTLASQMADARGTTLSLRLGAVSLTRTPIVSSRQVARQSSLKVTERCSATSMVIRKRDRERRAIVAASQSVMLFRYRPARQKVTTPHLLPDSLKPASSNGLKNSALVDRHVGLNYSDDSRSGIRLEEGQALVPTWTAFAVVGLLEDHFDDLVDYELTAKIEEDLDDIARGRRQKSDWLTRFYFGGDTLPGLKHLVEENLDQIDAASINSFPIGNDPDGNEIIAKPASTARTSSVETRRPASLTISPRRTHPRRSLATAFLPKSDDPIGTLDDLPVYAKNGRYGPYVQWGDPDNLPPGLPSLKCQACSQR